MDVLLKTPGGILHCLLQWVQQNVRLTLLLSVGWYLSPWAVMNGILHQSFAITSFPVLARLCPSTWWLRRQILAFFKYSNRNVRENCKTSDLPVWADCIPVVIHLRNTIIPEIGCWINRIFYDCIRGKCLAVALLELGFWKSRLGRDVAVRTSDLDHQ